MTTRLGLFVLLAAAIFVAPLAAAEFTLEKTDDGVTVNLDGKLFTKYVKLVQNKPVLSPVIGPTGKPMTRPLDEGDHPHHTSLWLTHGDVNGVDFWTNKGGLIEHLEYQKVESGETGVLAIKTAWHDKADAIVGYETRTMTFSAAQGVRRIDFDITFTAGDKPVTFGQTKEGSFGVRVWPTMTVDKNGGKILNSEGQTNLDAWSKPAAWVDYVGQVDGETLGIAILNHPDSLRFPTPWHVRTYGLFAANPFMHEALELKAGESFRLRYAVLLHAGDTAAADIAGQFKR
ncbi:MAG: PmoA family protein, partial [Planctomycetales bacterium]|nr:PmoA family protein [Planctomycetales bacterium]